MRVKRIFHEGAPSHLEFQTVGPVGSSQKLTQRLLEKGIAEGWLAIAGGEWTFKTADGQPDVVFKVVAKPGRYCAHCGEELPGNEADAREHIAAKHSSKDGEPKASPDPENPAGWAVHNYFLCERVS